MIHLLPVFLLFHWQMYIFKSTKSMKLMQPGSVSHGQRLPINTSVLNKGPALMVFWKTSSHFNTEKSVSAFFSAWVVCSQFIHFYRTAWEPQICCTLLRNYSACCTTLEGQHEDIYSSALWVCGCVCVCVCMRVKYIQSWCLQWRSGCFFFIMGKVLRHVMRKF